MRRVLFALCAMAAIGSYAEAGFVAVPENPILTGIQSFIAEQRRADAESCASMGKADIEACIRDLARQRRSQLEGIAVPAAPAGTDI